MAIDLRGLAARLVVDPPICSDPEALGATISRYQHPVHAIDVITFADGPNTRTYVFACVWTTTERFVAWYTDHGYTRLMRSSMPRISRGRMEPVERKHHEISLDGRPLPEIQCGYRWRAAPV